MIGFKNFDVEFMDAVDENLINEYFSQENEFFSSIPDELIKQEEYFINELEKQSFEYYMLNSIPDVDAIDLDYYEYEEGIRQGIELLINESSNALNDYIDDECLNPRFDDEFLNNICEEDIYGYYELEFERYPEIEIEYFHEYDVNHPYDEYLDDMGDTDNFYDSLGVSAKAKWDLIE